MKPRQNFLQRFLEQESASGFVLLGCACIAVIWANSPYASAYHGLLHLPVSVSFAGRPFELSLQHFINDALMAVFFFVVGLEIKRELVAGELSSRKRAMLPFAGALGGMLVPALLYTAFNRGTSGMPGWGIPMATDIAFSLAILSLVGKGLPSGLRIFLTALAIVDDLGAVVVIAIFYTASLNITALSIAAAVVAVLFAGNARGVRSPLFYVLGALLLWCAVFASGIHATVAGVLAAFTVPLAHGLSPKEYLRKLRHEASKIDISQASEAELRPADRETLLEIEHLTDDFRSPLELFIHKLHPWVSFVIMPLFALANSGVTIEGALGDALQHSIPLGIIAGLFIGKPLGIVLFSMLTVKAGIATLPSGSSLRALTGVGFIAGIGFTMSLFIASLAFGESELNALAKVGILFGSLLSALVGAAILGLSPKTEGK